MLLVLHRNRVWLLFVGMVFLLLGCASGSETLFQSQSRKAVMHGEYEVQAGDSLYSIAWRFNRDYKELAEINDIKPPYTIYIGQTISLARNKDEIPSKYGFTGQDVVSATSGLSIRQTQSSSPKPTATTKRQASRIPTSTPPRYVKGKMTWLWPVQGEIIQGFSASSVGKKGIQIAGRAGDPVKASASGQVVYSGDSLVGYGNLVIIKHNQTYLTAYAHNRKVLVKEGDNVKQGQQIAELGSSGTDRNKLHFEIRKEGKPVNPLSYLPQR